jgi:hypothetical protein
MKNESKRTATEASAVLAISTGITLVTSGNYVGGGGAILVGVGLFIAYERMAIRTIDIDRQDIQNLTETADELLDRKRKD